jgi:hypothetical protein
MRVSSWGLFLYDYVSEIEIGLDWSWNRFQIEKERKEEKLGKK